MLTGVQDAALVRTITGMIAEFDQADCATGIPLSGYLEGPFSTD
jgi:hypothetical protein